VGATDDILRIRRTRMRERNREVRIHLSLQLPRGSYP
jgi:hypothetical protein